VILYESGKGKAYIKEAFYPVKGGDLLLIGPDVRHQFISDRKDTVIASQVTFEILDRDKKPAFFSFDRLFDTLNLQGGEGMFHLKGEKYKKTRERIRDFIPFGDFPSDTDEFKRKSEIMLLSLLHFLGRTLGRLEIPENVKGPNKGVSDRVIEYLRSNYHGKITLEGIANEVFLSKSHLCRVFREETGKNIFDMLLEIRLKVAAGLLKNSLYAVKEIAHRTGFSDVYYFSKCFKKHFKIPPGCFSRDPAREPFLPENS
jgi:AraC-like DNA-binding protein